MTQVALDNIANALFSSEEKEKDLVEEILEVLGIEINWVSHSVTCKEYKSIYKRRYCGEMSNLFFSEIQLGKIEDILNREDNNLTGSNLYSVLYCIGLVLTKPEGRWSIKELKYLRG